jgi:hypothetical protein
MDAHFYAGPGHVIIDSCENCCLIWLDGGELMRIVQAPEDQFARNETLLTDSTMDTIQARETVGNLALDAAADILFGTRNPFSRS